MEDLLPIFTTYYTIEIDLQWVDNAFGTVAFNCLDQDGERFSRSEYPACEIFGNDFYTRHRPTADPIDADFLADIITSIVLRFGYMKLKYGNISRTAGPAHISRTAGPAHISRTAGPASICDRVTLTFVDGPPLRLEEGAPWPLIAVYEGFKCVKTILVLVRDETMAASMMDHFELHY